MLSSDQQSIIDITRRHGAITPGDWVVERVGRSLVRIRARIMPNGEGPVITGSLDRDYSENDPLQIAMDHEFLSCAPGDVGWLLAELNRALARLAHLESAVDLANAAVDYQWSHSASAHDDVVERFEQAIHSWQAARGYQYNPE